MIDRPWYASHGLVTRHKLSHGFPLFEGTPQGWAEEFAGKTLAAVDSLQKASGEAAQILADGDLTPEARHRRAAEKFDTAAADLLQALANERNAIDRERVKVEAERDSISVSRTGGESDFARQLALDRTLSHIRSLAPSKRALFVLDSAKAGDALPVQAVTLPGVYEVLAQPEVISEARRTLAELSRPELGLQLSVLAAKAKAANGWEMLIFRHVERQREATLGRVVVPIRPDGRTVEQRVAAAKGSAA